MPKQIHWELTDAELGAFMASLTEERATMPLTLEQLRAAEVIVTYREENGTIAGIAGSRRIHRLPVLFMVVHRQYQKRGHGIRLLKRMEEVTRARGGHVLIMSAQRSIPRVFSAYRKLGYWPVFNRGMTAYMFKIF
jgi:GNAT superfamily N-acetyltransferase